MVGWRRRQREWEERKNQCVGKGDAAGFCHDNNAEGSDLPSSIPHLHFPPKCVFGDGELHNTDRPPNPILGQFSPSQNRQEGVGRKSIFLFLENGPLKNWNQRTSLVLSAHT